MDSLVGTRVIFNGYGRMQHVGTVRRDNARRTREGSVLIETERGQFVRRQREHLSYFPGCPTRIVFRSWETEPGEEFWFTWTPAEHWPVGTIFCESCNSFTPEMYESQEWYDKDCMELIGDAPAIIKCRSCVLDTILETIEEARYNTERMGEALWRIRASAERTGATRS